MSIKESGPVDGRNCFLSSAFPIAAVTGPDGRLFTSCTGGASRREFFREGGRSQETGAPRDMSVDEL